MKIKIMTLAICLVLVSCEGGGNYYESEYYKENSFFETCLKEGRSQTECDLLYQEKKMLKAEQEAAESGYD